MPPLRIVLLAALVSTLPTCASAFAAEGDFGPPPMPATRPAAPYDRQLNRALSLLVGGRIDEMLGQLEFSPQVVGSEDFEVVRQRLASLQANAGRCDGFDVVAARPLTARFQQVFALAYFERRPVLLVFQFYQVNGRWRAHDITVSTDLTPFLDALPPEPR